MFTRKCPHRHSPVPPPLPPVCRVPLPPPIPQFFGMSLSRPNSSCSRPCHHPPPPFLCYIFAIRRRRRRPNPRQRACLICCRCRRLQRCADIGSTRHSVKYPCPCFFQHTVLHTSHILVAALARPYVGCNRAIAPTHFNGNPVSYTRQRIRHP